MNKKLLILLSASIIGAPLSRAIDFNFLQPGYEDDAFVAGSFSGSDLNNDGFLFIDELSGFELTWSGNGVIPTFGLGLADLLVFSYELDTPLLGDISLEGIASFNGAAYVAGIGAINAVLPGLLPPEITGVVILPGSPDPLVTGTQAPIFVERVQVPDGGSTLYLSGVSLGLLALFAARRRRSFKGCIS